MPDTFTIDDKLYLELIPDEAAKCQLRTVAASLPDAARGHPVPATEWHVTVVHIGKLRAAFSAVKRAAPALSEARFIALVNSYAAAAGPLLPALVTLRPAGWDMFGAARNVLVLRFDAPAELADLHATALRLLRTLFADCGVTNAEAFMQNDPNFRHALTLRPHLALLRGAHASGADVLPAVPSMLSFYPADLRGL